MKRLVLLPQARRDLVWFRLYYDRTFPEGRKAAGEQYLSVLRTLREYPGIGQLVLEDVRRFPINRTPFVILYRAGERIEVLRIRDQRSKLPASEQDGL